MPVNDLAKRGFGADLGSAMIYDRGRPGYADGVVAMLAGEFALDRSSRLLDLAAGTGQVARLFAPIVGSVIAVEPSAAMREVLAREIPAAEVMPGEAERIPVPDGSVDAAIVGSALHWFDAERAIQEPGRVIRSGADWQSFTTSASAPSPRRRVSWMSCSSTGETQASRTGHADARPGGAGRSIAPETSSNHCGRPR